jgi:hypothetical protein
MRLKLRDRSLKGTNRLSRNKFVKGEKHLLLFIKDRFHLGQLCLLLGASGRVGGIENQEADLK